MGWAVDPEGIICIRKKFFLEGLLSVNLTPMGGNLVLIRSIAGERIEDTIRDRDKEFSQWFKEIRLWNPNLIAKERTMWLKITGVPAHVWGENIFKHISQLMGTFVALDESTRDKARLDVGRVLITTSIPNTINKVVEVKVNGIIHDTCHPFVRRIFRG